MDSRRVIAFAPSNIAIIKYMGKADAASNLPANGSLSMTLSGLGTWMEIHARPVGKKGRQYVWNLSEFPEGASNEARIPDLSERSRVRMQAHWDAVFQAPGGEIWEIRTANSFPMAAGIASSASSFAAATLAGFALTHPQEASRWDQDTELRSRVASLSQRGSGSSCRSLDGPWIMWQGTQARALQSSLKADDLCHFVLVVSAQEKSVSSSAAHQRVLTSPKWRGRPERAEQRLKSCAEALANGRWDQLCTIAWEEAHDMHELFHTATEPFSYQTDKTKQLLAALEPEVHWARACVTMDAGANVHVIVKKADRERILQIADQQGVRVLEDCPGLGAKVVLS